MEGSGPLVASLGRVNAAKSSPLLDRHRPRGLEAAFWCFAAAAFFLFPNHLPLATSCLVMALFAASLDLALGYAGIITLGHALHFGIGAYAAGLIAVAGYREAVSGAMFAGLCSAIAGAALAPLILRFSGVALIMVTLALGVMAHEVANKATWLTGGHDGLQVAKPDRLLELFDWTVVGQTGYLYALAWVFVLVIALRIVIASPFGVALQGIRDNPLRMRFIGAPVRRYLNRAYVLSAFIAGVAGALSAQTSQFVALDVLSVNTSVEVLVMLVLGGSGRLYGGLIGATVYILVRHFAAEWNPYHWMFVVGLLLIVVVKFGRGGLLGMMQGLVPALVVRSAAK